MNLNVFNPKIAVQKAFSRPNPVLAIALVLLAGLSGIVASMILGVQVDAVAVVANNELRGLLRLAAFLLAFVVISMIARRQSGKILGLLSSLSLNFLVSLAGSIVIAAGLALFVSKQALQAIVSGVSRQGNILELARTLRFSTEINLVGLFVVAVISIILAILNVMLLYFTAKEYLSASKLFAVILALAVPIAIFMLPI